MAANGTEILREYLVALGFRTDEPEQRKFVLNLQGLDRHALNLGKSLIGAGTAATTMATLYARSMERLFYSSQRAESTVGTLQAMAFGGKQVGISGEAMTAAIEGMARALRSNPGLTGLLESFGVKTAGRDRADVMVDLVEKLRTMPFFIGSQFAQMFGLDSDTFLMLSQNLEKLKEAAALQKQMAADAGYNADEAARVAVEYAKLTREITEMFSILKDTAAVGLLPMMRQVAGVVKEVLRDWTALFKRFQKPPSNVASSNSWIDEAGWYLRGLGVLGPRESPVIDPGRAGRISSGGVTGPGGDATKLPLGLRQNNPGNLRSWGNTPTANGFASFSSMQEGLSALAGNLLTYQNKHGLKSIQEIISRYAPPSENNTAAYIAAVAKQMGVGASDTLDLNDPAKLSALMAAIVKHENGRNPFDPSQIRAAADSRLAGGGVQVNQKTDITVVSSDPDTAGRRVAEAQDSMQAEIIRYLGRSTTR